MSPVARTRWKLVGYSLWATANVFLVVMEFMRDDVRWWKVALNVILFVVGLGGAIEQARALKAQPAVQPGAAELD